MNRLKISRVFRAAALCIVTGASALFASAAAAQWNGQYVYERTFANSKGERGGEIYNLTLGPKGACRISMTGPAAHEDIVCRTAQSEKSVTVHFRRHADKAAAKLNKARNYKADQRLLTLEMGVNDRPKAIRTIWHNLRTMDGAKPKTGERFKRVSK
jgi:hypothetical protein